MRAAGTTPARPIEVVATADEEGRLLPAGLAVDPVTGAGHDARTMRHVTRSGQIFVPSKGGISHAPRQDTVWTGGEWGANVPPHGLLALAS